MALTFHLRWESFTMPRLAFLKEQRGPGKKLKDQWGEGQAHINVIFS